MNKEKELKQQIKQLQEENRILLHQVDELNKKLVESESFKSHFLSNVSNEIINPFASVMGLAQQIMNLKENRTNKAAELARLIFSEAATLDFQLNNIFVAARLEAGEETPEYTSINILEITGHALDNIRHKADDKQIKFDLDIASGLTGFVTDRKKLELILINLLDNAIKFSPSGITVALRVKRSGKNLAIEIEDKGIGMKKEEITRIFDRFHRANPTIQSLTPGSGLGLAVVEGLLFILGGKAEINSAPDRGTTVRILIPEGNPENITFDDNLFFEENENEESF